jgi:predicted metal-dependent phosphoesterase TrpH
MHIHSYYSGPCTTPFVRHFCRESYNHPEDVYSLLQQRGMNLFTLTDHDSIEGGEKLRGRANFFLSEELTCRMPSGTEIHVGVYDIHERHHDQLQQRRNDLVGLLMYLTERKLFFTINHVFSNLTGIRKREDFLWFAEFFPAMETCNGQMLEGANANAARLAKRWEKIEVGGSDAHALASAGTAYTEVPGARDKEEFFAGLRQGLGRARGESGNFRKLTRDVFWIALELMREKAWTRAIAPLALFIPVITYLNYYFEGHFNREWGMQFFGEIEDSRRRPRWLTLPPRTAEESA